MLKSLFNAAYLAIFLEFTIRISRKLNVGRCKRYLVLDLQGYPFVIMVVAPDTFNEPFPVKCRHRGQPSLLWCLSERSIARRAAEASRDVLSIAEAEYANPDMFGIESYSSIRLQYADTTSAAARVRKAMLHMLD